MSYDDYKLETPPKGKTFSYEKEPIRIPYLERIEGTDLYITRFGIILDKDGKEIKMNNK